ncbi:hypothetical protein PINS_up004732 [Pythium insidiosum]|nr:hypothetical protein PINS_up004732 [Pythium insidiosum]
MPEVLATPTGATFTTKMDFQSPLPHARLASASLMASSDGRKAFMPPLGMQSVPLSLPMTCNFEALSHHFHLPLKVAAERFGVRATAFKKRCRAIGIRHWPYRKVRSLKRSLQELNRCREQGLLNDKQHQQLHVFQSQLDKLLSPETYGIDPSGRLPPGAFDNVDDNDSNADGDGDDDDDASCASNQSPRVENVAALSDFKISSFRSKRTKKLSAARQASPVVMSKRGFSLPSSDASSHSAAYRSVFDTEEFERDTFNGFENSVDAPSVSARFTGHQAHSSSGLSGFETYDPFFPRLQE